MRGIRASAVAGIVSLAAMLCAVMPAAGAGVPERAIVFVRDGNLWTMDARGGQQRQITTDGVGHVSASPSGTIAYDRFLPYGPPKQLADLNIYQTAIGETEPRTLTSDNKSRDPVVSPDGTKIAFQKFEWKGERNYLGRGRGVWIVDTATGEQRELVGQALLPDGLKQQRDKLFRFVDRDGMNASNWVYDSNLIWAGDSKGLLFTRNYEKGGAVSYFIDLTSDDAPKVLPYLSAPCGRDLRGTEMLCFDNGSMSLVVHDFHTGQSRTLATSVFVGDAKYSPNGQRVAFVVKSGVHLTQSDLWTVDSSGSNLKKISSTPLHDVDELWWTADGQRLVFERYYSAENRSEVWSVASDGSDLRRLAENAKDPRPTRGSAAVVEMREKILPLKTLWGQKQPLYVDTTSPPCVQVPCEKGADGKGCDGLSGVKVGCAAVAVGQLINYYLENGYANGWLDTMLLGIDVYPRPWSKGGIGQSACTHPGFTSADSYQNAGWDQLKQFLWHVGIGLDIDYGEDAGSFTVYPSEKLFALTLQNADKLAELLEARFRFKLLAGPSAEVSRLDELAVGIMQAIDAGRPVLLRLAQPGNAPGHVALVQGYRISTTEDTSWGEASAYEFLLNLGAGPNIPLRWVRGDRALDLSNYRFTGFQMIDVAPVAASAVPVSR